jgi:hypothetical protein
MWEYWTLKRAIAWATILEPNGTSTYIVRHWWGYGYVPSKRVVAYCAGCRNA